MDLRRSVISSTATSQGGRDCIQGKYIHIDAEKELSLFRLTPPLEDPDFLGT